jgi:prepilin-type N-terminal cleavage/methylation domain-containing protein
MLNLLKSKKFQVGFTFVLKSSRSRQRGFTLIELLIAVSIIVILITIGAVSYTTVNRNARDSQRQSDLAKIAAALEEYYADHGTYPNTNVGGQFETAGRDCDFDKICCLLGGTIAENNVKASPPSTWKCTAPFNSYINPGEQMGAVGSVHTFKGIPRDPLTVDPYEYSSAANPDNSYAYASNNGQSYVLTTMKYEGSPPSSNQFSLTFSSYYYPGASTWRSDIDWANQYAIKSPNH